MNRQKRHEQLGIPADLYKQAVRRLVAATADYPLWWRNNTIAVAERVGLTAPELRAVAQALSDSKLLTPEQVRLVNRLAIGPPPSTRRIGPEPSSARPDIIPTRTGDIVYITTSARSSAFHSYPDCPLLRRGQAAAATMHKSVWPIEAVGQIEAEAEGHVPCTFCIENVGAATLIRSIPRHSSTTKKQAVDQRNRQGVLVRQAAEQRSKKAVKRERARYEAARLGISVTELKARRRAEHEANIARKDTPS